MGLLLIQSSLPSLPFTRASLPPSAPFLPSRLPPQRHPCGAVRFAATADPQPADDLNRFSSPVHLSSLL
ncbi:hypothetical protein TIFTF001_021436 [Ficus carica]|uniref:Uncharacterized protein n=1 Tax=Ficus carica TaxID=3494 RepID=A0AA88AUX5_FICCA|nr:hypothetical protein TIFTF001_021436 [Ficus carica]